MESEKEARISHRAWMVRQRAEEREAREREREAAEEARRKNRARLRREKRDAREAIEREKAEKKRAAELEKKAAQRARKMAQKARREAAKRRATEAKRRLAAERRYRAQEVTAWNARVKRAVAKRSQRDATLNQRMAWLVRSDGLLAPDSSIVHTVSTSPPALLRPPISHPDHQHQSFATYEQHFGQAPSDHQPQAQPHYLQPQGLVVPHDPTKPRKRRSTVLKPDQLPMPGPMHATADVGYPEGRFLTKAEDGVKFPAIEGGDPPARIEECHPPPKVLPRGFKNLGSAPDGKDGVQHGSGEYADADIKTPAHKYTPRPQNKTTINGGAAAAADDSQRVRHPQFHLEKILHELVTDGSHGAEWWPHDPERTVVLVTDGVKLARACQERDWHSLNTLMGSMGMLCVGFGGSHGWPRYFQYLGPCDDHLPAIFSQFHVTALPRKVRSATYYGDPVGTTRWRNPIDGSVTPPFLTLRHETLPNAKHRFGILLAKSPRDPRFAVRPRRRYRDDVIMMSPKTRGPQRAGGPRSGRTNIVVLGRAEPEPVAPVDVGAMAALDQVAFNQKDLLSLRRLAEMQKLEQEPTMEMEREWTIVQKQQLLSKAIVICSFAQATLERVDGALLASNWDPLYALWLLKNGNGDSREDYDQIGKDLALGRAAVESIGMWRVLKAREGMDEGMEVSEEDLAAARSGARLSSDSTDEEAPPDEELPWARGSAGGEAVPLPPSDSGNEVVPPTVDEEADGKEEVKVQEEPEFDHERLLAKEDVEPSDVGEAEMPCDEYLEQDEGRGGCGQRPPSQPQLYKFF